MLCYTRVFYCTSSLSGLGVIFLSIQTTVIFGDQNICIVYTICFVGLDKVVDKNYKICCNVIFIKFLEEKST